MTAIDLITKEDLKQLEIRLLSAMNALMHPEGGGGQSKKWLKSQEVRKLLKISPGTLQNLRINGTLHYTKIGGILYYKLEDITKLLEGGMQ
jgi:hypothetical protein